MKRALLLLLLPLGCSFPEVEIVAADASMTDARTDSSVTDSLADETESDAATDGAADSSSSDSASDSSIKTDGACVSGDPCDCDGDGDRKKGGSCGGTDCDDNDPRAHVGAGFRTDAPTAITGGDWNCDGKVDKFFKDGISCSLLGDCTVTGFTDKPACGAMGTFTTCKVVPLGCATNTTKPDTQGCK